MEALGLSLAHQPFFALIERGTVDALGGLQTGGNYPHPPWDSSCCQLCIGFAAGYIHDV